MGIISSHFDIIDWHRSFKLYNNVQEVRTMRIVEIIKIIKDAQVKIVTLSDLKKMLDINEDNTAYKIAAKLVKEKLLQRLKKGVYASIFYPPENFEVANALYSPSYVSLETALNHYGVLSQFPYSITSVSPKKSKKLAIEGKEYEYTQISPKLYWGFKREGQILIASPEKALLDTIYLAAKGMRRIEFSELDYSNINKRKFSKMCREIKYLPFLNKLKEIKLC